MFVAHLLIAISPNIGGQSNRLMTTSNTSSVDIGKCPSLQTCIYGTYKYLLFSLFWSSRFLNRRRNFSKLTIKYAIRNGYSTVSLLLVTIVMTDVSFRGIQCTRRIHVYISNGDELEIPRNGKQPEENVTIFILRWRSKIMCIRLYVWHAKNCAQALQRRIWSPLA